MRTTERLPPSKQARVGRSRGVRLGVCDRASGGQRRGAHLTCSRYTAECRLIGVSIGRVLSFALQMPQQLAFGEPRERAGFWR